MRRVSTCRWASALCGAFALSCAPVSGRAQGKAAASIPTARAVDHIGVTVPDLDRAVKFFCDVLGADLLWRTPIAGLPDEEMNARYHVDSRSRSGLAMLRLGPNINLEVLQYHASGQQLDVPRNDELGTPHLAFRVDDVDAACRWLEQHGCTLLGGPTLSPPENVHGGQVMRYCLAPWRMVIEILSQPEPQPYERHTTARAYGPAAAWTANGNDAATPRLPTARNLDHVGVNVPDVSAAVRYFVEVLGADLLWTDGPIADAKGNTMQEKFGAGPRDSLTVALLRCGPNLNVELLQYRGPDNEPLGRIRPNSDVDAVHIAFLVDDIKAAAAYLQSQGTTMLAGPNLDDDPASGKRGEFHQYFLTPWGASLELVQRPEHLPYETQTKARSAPAATAWR